ncbi:MAG: DEAD/DEAH box helicase [Bacteroidota bacterium]
MPAPKKGFQKYDLHDRVLSALPKLGYKRPTEVQERVLTQFLQGYNLIVEAPTGTGKTAAYGLPLISKIDLYKRKTQALILVPSRELAFQVSAALESFFDGDMLKVALLVGGVPVQESFQTIKKEPHILVAVPGRLRDVMAHYQWDYLWRDIKFLIIDEGDKLLETGFQRDFDLLRMHIRSTAQYGFFSATISRDSEELIKERISPIKTIRLSPQQMLRNINFYLTMVEEGKREPYLSSLIGIKEIPQALIFCGKREEIYAVTGYLRNQGLKAESYFGSMDQVERKNILSRFQQGHIDYLVASDLAARGLDIADLPAVINLSIPEEFDYYLHRVGRTGRAGKSGEVYNLVSSEMEQYFLLNHHELISIRPTVLEIQASTEAPTANSNDKWMKFHFSRGKRDKIRKGDIVGFLTQQANLPADQIGTITVYDQYSVVDMPSFVMKRLEKAEPLKIKGKSVKIRKFLQAEQERKARSNQRLKKDRK